MNVGKRVMMTMGFALAAAVAQAGIGVTNVVATPRWPWNGKVDVAYEVLADDPQTNLWVNFGGRDEERGLAVPMRTLAGDGADGRVRPGKRRATWDAAADAPGANAAAFEVTVTVSAGEKYLVVDLSGGINAASYPVTYLGDVPAGGWTDEYKTTKLVLRRVPAGTFTMGSPVGELGHSTYETQHQVTLTKDFYIGVFEVTQKQWQLVTGTTPSYYKGDTRPVEGVSYNDIRGTVNGAAWPTNGQVDAGSFLGKLRARTAITLDLPTEAQWEYACRAGTSTALNSGNNLTNAISDASVSEVGRYYYNQSDGKGGYSQHTKVGSYKVNAWGLYDMHGNVMEWCLDWMVWSSLTGNATDPKGATSGINRVSRSWFYNGSARRCRSADRGCEDPGLRGSGHGLRVLALPAVQ